MSVAFRLFIPPLAIALAWSPQAAQASFAPEPAAPAVAPPDSEPSAETQTREDPQLKRAMESYQLGTSAYNAARYDDALGHFQEAATLYASPDFQYNIGLCYERLGKPEEAIRAFRTYLRAKPNAPDRANVEDRIFQLEKELAERDDADTPPEPAPQPPPPAPAPDNGAGKALIITGAVLTGVGGVLALGGGLGFGLVARSRSDEVDEIQTGGNPNNRSFGEAQDLEDEGRRAETLQIVTAAVGAAVAVTGVALLVVGLRRKKAAAQGPTASIVPTFSPRAAGLSLQGRF